MKVGAIVGPFKFAVQHVHNLPHINGRERTLIPHKHMVSLRLHFQAVSADKPSFLDIHTTRRDLENRLKNILEGRTFDTPFEQVGVEIFNNISEWIPDFCKKFKLEQTFTLAKLDLRVKSENDELHHSRGVTQYFVEADTPSLQ